MRRCLLIFVFACGLSFLFVAPASADTLRIQPLEFQTSLKKSETKKSFVDVTNPTASEVKLRLYVNGFKQVDDKGNLTFFNNEQLAAGIKLDYDEVALGSRQTLRLYFVIDGTKLPTGDIFAAIFAESIPVQRAGTNTAVRVGSLLMLTNQTPGARHAEIAELTIPFMQLGNGLDGTVAVKNPAPKNAVTGFFPKMSVDISPWGGKEDFKGPLVFAGNTRTLDFHKSTNLFGFYSVKVKANDAEKTVIVFFMTGWWRIVAPLILILIVGGAIIFWKYRPRKHVHFHRRS